MNAFISKLADLGYEFFGIILPGVVTALGLLLLWIAAGPFLAGISGGVIPCASFAGAKAFIDSLASWSGYAFVVFLVALSYILGHILKWLSHGGKEISGISHRDRLWGFLRFSPPKPTEAFDDDFKPLHEAVVAHMKERLNVEISWKAFYSTTRPLVLKGLPFSLLTTYQNKYTLHRSLATLGATMMWLVSGCLMLWIICKVLLAEEGDPNLVGMILLLLGSFGMLDLFSRSYLFNWKLWGNSVVAESTALFLLRGENGNE